MSFFDLVSTRHSVRAFEDKPISDDVMQKILNATVCAPSAGNLQSYRIFIVIKKEIKRQLASAAHNQDFVGDAAALFVFCADPATSSSEYGVRGAELYCIQDATIACTFAQLAAHSLGLGTVWVGSFDEVELSEILRIPQHLKPVAMLVVGYAAEKPEITPRKPLGEVIHII
jgi:nitroreductase